MKYLKNKILTSIKNNTPFVLFRKPNQTKGTAFFQQNNSTFYIDNFSEKGFVFAPFDATSKTLYIPFSIADEFSFEKINTINFEASENKKTASNIAKKLHIALVENGINFMKTSEVKKVVLSRKEQVKISNFDGVAIYNKLLNNYPTAYVYLWFHPVSGLWMGATPEVLLKKEQQKFSIMALAATQEYKHTLNVVWGEKEQKEHQIVVDYITNKFDEKQLEISETYTVKAGNLVHLRTDIKGKIDETNFSLQKIIKSLHPTPATCGLPKEKAKKFIVQNENYKRAYYTGFLGEVKYDFTDLYVNLRCMEIDLTQKCAYLYIGGGITEESNPEKEWLETVAKSSVMKKVL